MSATDEIKADSSASVTVAAIKSVSRIIDDCAAAGGSGKDEVRLRRHGPPAIPARKKGRNSSSLVVDVHLNPEAEDAAVSAPPPNNTAESSASSSTTSVQSATKPSKHSVSRFQRCYSGDGTGAGGGGGAGGSASASPNVRRKQMLNRQPSKRDEKVRGGPDRTMKPT